MSSLRPILCLIAASIILLSSGTFGASPSDSVAETYLRFQSLGESFLAELKKTGWPEIEPLVETPELIATTTRFRDAMISEINNHLFNMRALFKILNKKMPKFAAPEYTATPQPFFKIYDSLESLITQYFLFQRDKIRLPLLIKELRRENQQLLNLPETQQSLSRVLTDSISFLALQSIHRHFLGDGKPATSDLQIDTVMGITSLEEIRSATDHYFEKAPNETFIAKLDKILFEQLLMELKRNAGEATIRRRGELNAQTKPVTKLLKEAGHIVIQIEDYGDPQEWLSAQGIGYTTQGIAQSKEKSRPRVGLGIGMFRSEVLSEVQGIEVQRRAKTDGEGTITDIIIGFHPSKICSHSLSQISGKSAH